MFKRILVAVYGSPPSNAGLSAAIRLAKDQKVSLVVLHVLEGSLAAINYPGEYISPAYMDTYIRAIQEKGENVLDRAVSLARKTLPKADPAMVHARHRTVAHAILDQAKKSKADTIVVGTHGRRGLRRILMGSDAEARRARSRRAGAARAWLRDATRYGAKTRVHRRRLTAYRCLDCTSLDGLARQVDPSRQAHGCRLGDLR